MQWKPHVEDGEVTRSKKSGSLIILKLLYQLWRAHFQTSLPKTEWSLNLSCFGLSVTSSWTSLITFLPPAPFPFPSTSVSLCAPSPCSWSLFPLYPFVAPSFHLQIYLRAIFIHSQFDLLWILIDTCSKIHLLQLWVYQVLLLPDSQPIRL